MCGSDIVCPTIDLLTSRIALFCSYAGCGDERGGLSSCAGRVEVTWGMVLPEAAPVQAPPSPQPAWPPE
eukprot:3934329-Rhodomonas_salina.1